jgi:hypothetical protein
MILPGVARGELCKIVRASILNREMVDVLHQSHRMFGTLVVFDGDQYIDYFTHALFQLVPLKIVLVCGKTVPHLITGDMTMRVCPVEEGDGQLIVYELNI